MGEPRYDWIVVGGGTAGVILAARLSEDRGSRVLLLEAGPDYPRGLPAELLDASAPVTSGHNWDLLASAGEAEAPGPAEPLARASRVLELVAARLGPGAASASASSPSFPSSPAPSRGAPAPGAQAAGRFAYPMAKVIGGGSAINGALAWHARREDYAAWAAAGNDWWSWERVRAAMDRVERPGVDKGALPLATPGEDELTLVQRAFLDACRETGQPAVDLRQGTAPGVGMVTKNVAAGRRVSVNEIYLDAARRRPNLTVRGRCLADRLTFEPRGGALVASGVEALIEGRREHLAGGHVVLAAGAIHSPAIVLRSGVGAAAAVERAGGRPLLDLPGVGGNLADHPAVSLWAPPRAGACRAGEPVHQVMLQQHAGRAAALCDLQLFMISALPAARLPPLGDVIGADLACSISVVLATPRSRGRVELDGLDPLRPPRIQLNFLQEAADLERMVAGMRSAWRLLGHERLAAVLERVVVWDQGLMEAEPHLEKVMRANVRGAWHPVGTLRMGAAADREAVVDQYGSLHGCRNVTVADASILPGPPSVPTNLTCMLVAERIAGRLRGQA
jgi:choline dehydrogenase